MAQKILLYKCWNCQKWGDFQNDPECECGVNVYENGDLFNEGQTVETCVIDATEAVDALCLKKK